MPSTASNSLRLQKMATGEKLNTWGAELNSSVIELIEDAIAGYEELTITGNVTLTSTNYATDQARMAMLELGGSPGSAFNVTIPAQTKWYLVKNTTSVNATMTAGGVGAIVYPGEFIAVMCDGTDVARQEFSRLGQTLNAGGFRIENLGAPTADAHAATKKYVDDQDATLLSDVAAAQAAAEAAQVAAETAQSLAETAETNAAASYDSFDDRYLGAKTSDPALDNDGAALITGALIWRSDLGYFKVYNGASWDALPSGTMGAQDADSVSITGGTIDGTAIGGTTPAAGAFTTLRASDGTSTVEVLNSGGVGIVGTDTNHRLDLRTNNVAAITIDTSQQVGIGTLAPSYALEVVGTINAQGGKLYAGGSTVEGNASAPHIGFSLDPDTGMFRAGINELGFAVGGSEAMRIDSSGNVGIGATSPSGLLHLQDGSSGGTAYSFANQFIIESNAATGMSILMPDANSGEYGFSTVSRTRAAGIRFNHDNALLDIFTNLSGGIIAFHTTVFSEAMRIDSSGNVGIGTTSPDGPLHVDGAGTTATFENSTPIVLLKSKSDTSTGRLYFGDTSADLRGAIFYGHDTDYMGLWTAGSEKLRVQQNGNVGIGTTSPDTLLDLRPIAYTTNQLGGISLQTTGGQLRWDIAVGTSGTGAGFFRITEPSDVLGNTHTIAEHLSDEWAFHTAGSERVRIDSSGRVGIGTTSPDYGLDVGTGAAQISGTSTPSLRFLANATGGDNRILFGDPDDDDAGGIYYFHTTNSMAFRAQANVTRMTLDATGLGIGITAVSYALQVQGDTAAYVARLQSNTTGAYLLLTDATTTNQNHVRVGAVGDNMLLIADSHRFNADGAGERMRLDATGLGIATTSPNVELDVDGQFATRAGAKLTISSGAITVTHSFHEIQSETVGADNLDTINGGHDGAILVLRAESGVEEAITLTNSGNIIGPVGSISGDDTATLMYDATRSAWIILSRT